MNILTRLIIYTFICIVFTNCDLSSDKTKSKVIDSDLKSVDGPYIYELDKIIKVVEVKHDHDTVFYIKEQLIEKQKNLTFSSAVNNADRDEFSFSLMNSYDIPDAEYRSQDKIFVTSDIEGNFNAFYSMLVGSKIMDSNYNWIFNKGHLVIAGDMMDRGKDVIPCLWLLYKLEQDAKSQGGQVHFILGNHDVMNLQLDIRYVRLKYLNLAKIVSGEEDKKKAYEYLMSKNNELVKWIASKNTVEKIGDLLILHGGISPEIVDSHLSLDEINTIVRTYVDENLMRNPRKNDRANLVFSRMGPLWYRGLAIDYKEHYKKLTLEDVDAILDFYGVKHIIVGHTIIDKEISSGFNGKVIYVDIKHSKEKFSGKSQALLIKGGIFYKINDKGEKYKLDF